MVSVACFVNTCVCGPLNIRDQGLSHPLCNSDIIECHLCTQFSEPKIVIIFILECNQFEHLTDVYIIYMQIYRILQYSIYYICITIYMISYTEIYLRKYDLLNKMIKNQISPESQGIRSLHFPSVFFFFNLFVRERERVQVGGAAGKGRSRLPIKLGA